MGINVFKFVSVRLFRIVNVLIIMYAIWGLSLSFTDNVRWAINLNLLVLFFAITSLIRARKITNDSITFEQKNYLLMQMIIACSFVSLASTMYLYS